MSNKLPLTLLVDGITVVGQIVVPDGCPPEGAPAVVFCHGIPAGPPDLSDSGYALMAEATAAEGYAAVIFNFRGCGISGGNFDHAGWGRDLSAVVDHVAALPSVDPSRIALVGFSNGGAAAIYVAANDPRVAAVATCAAPAQLGRVFGPGRLASFIAHGRQIGIIRDAEFPPSVDEWAAAFERMSPVKWVARISPRPLLIIHGSEDELIPLENAHKLFGAAGEPKELVVLQGAGHRLRRDRRAFDKALGWLKATMTTATK